MAIIGKQAFSIENLQTRGILVPAMTLIPAILTACFFALTGLCARRSASLIGSLRANTYRLLIAMLAMGSILLIPGKPFPAPYNIAFLCIGGVGFGLGGACVLRALPLLGTPLTLLVVECGAAIASGILSILFSNDTLLMGEWLACLVILSGVALALYPRNKPSSGLISHGLLLGIAGAILQAASLVASRAMFVSAKGEGIPLSPLEAAAWRLTGGFAVALVLGVILNNWKNRWSIRDEWHKLLPTHPGNWYSIPLIWVSLNALFGPILGITTWLWAVSMTHPAIVQSVAACSPLLSLPFASKWESFDHPWRFTAGGSIALCGVIALYLI